MPLQHDGTVVSWSGGTFRIAGPIFHKWRDEGGPEAWWPLGEAAAFANGSTHIQHFVHRGTGELASLCSHSQTGTWWSAGSVRVKWYHLGAEASVFGLPCEAPRPTLRGQFAIQSVNAAGHVETRTYDRCHGKVATLIGPNGLTTAWEYDSFGRLRHELRSNGTETRTLYLLVEEGGPEGAVYQIRR